MLEAKYQYLGFLTILKHKVLSTGYGQALLTVFLQTSLNNQ